MGARPSPGTLDEAVRDLRAQVDNPTPPSDTVTLVVSHVDVEAVLDELAYLRAVDEGVQRLRARMARESDTSRKDDRYLWVREIVDLLDGRLT